MKSPAADTVLSAVRRRLRLGHAADSAGFAAWTTVAVAAVAVLLHLFVRPVSLGAFALWVSICWVGALMQATATRITDSDCAAWADRFLGGHSAYATYLEYRDATGRQDSPAWRRLIEWLETTAPHSVAQLESMRPDAGLLKPAAVAVVAAMLAVVLLQLPPHRGAQMSAQLNAEEARGRGTASASVANTDESPAAGSGSGGQPQRSSRDEKPRGGSPAMSPPTAEKRATAERVNTADAQLQAAGASEAAAGGRDAGESPDTVPDPGLSEAWQGAMTASLRSLSAPPQAAERTDAAVAADYTDASRSQAATHSPMLAAAAAVAPESRRATPLGPAEQAYVRAYFAGSGAEP